MRRSLTILVVALLLLIVPTSLSALIQSEARHVAAPITRPLHTAFSSIRNTVANIRQLPSLFSERTALQTQVVRLEEELLGSESVLQENEVLRKELGVTGVVSQKKKVLTHVLTESSDPLDRLVSVDVGSQQGIRLGQPVTVEGALVGRIFQVGLTTAIVRPITSVHSAIQVSINGQNGLLAGDGSSSFIGDIPQGTQLLTDTLIQTSGLGGSLPAGILIGTLQETLAKPSDITQKFRVALPYSGRPLTTLMILTTQ